MKHTINHIIKEPPESKELLLWAENDREIYNEIFTAAVYFAKKMKKGIFDEMKAIDRLYPIATHAARVYAATFGGVYHQMFDTTARYTVAAELAKAAQERALEILEEAPQRL